jgi:hypothetical protein
VYASAAVLDVVPSCLREVVGGYVMNQVLCPPLRADACVMHNDIGAEHVLLDAATGRVTGLIDFADLAVGDPAGDFAGLASIGGFRLVRRALDAYGLPVDEVFVGRVQWRTRALHLHWLDEALKHGEDVASHRALVIDVFEDTL